ncbi:MAG: nucleotide exchange factor GrpE [Candidatus Sungbacteria bacterium]|nr:nucleotide exchange factor GrpE [Candidatus Sungbacteria bacterium]
MSDDLQEIEILPDEEGDPPDLQKKIKKLKKDLDECEKVRKEYLDGWQRAKADHINYRNDEGKRFEDMARFVTAGLIQEILPVLDSFDLALGHGLSPDVEKGILLIRSQFEDILKKRGLKQIEVETGEEFNPERHESIGEIESDAPPGKIAEVVQRGFIFHDRILRPARVRLARVRS